MMPDESGPGPLHRRLQRFVGRWRTEGEILGGPPGASARLQATDSYEWLPGGYFLLHRVEGRLGDEPVQTLEVIGYDAERHTYFSHAFDDRGNARTYTAGLSDDGTWSIVGSSERFTGSFSADGTALVGTWERLADGGEWARWMTIRLTKSA